MLSVLPLEDRPIDGGVSSGKGGGSRPEPDLLHLVQTSLDDDKAEEIVHVDLSGKTAIADHMVVATGRSTRHVAAIADHLIERIRDAGAGRPRVEGLSGCDWVLVDAGDVIVHIFRPEVRTFYNIEKMWAAELTAPTAGRHHG